MLAELLATPGVREEHVLRSRFGFMAFHGGSLEEGTDDIAAEAATRAGASLYAVAQPDGLRWHIPSKLVTPEHSPALGRFLDHVEAVVAVHGFGRDGMFTTLLLGGGDRQRAAWLASRLRPALPHYEIVDDLEAIPAALRGLHPDNPVNRVPAGGVQLELPPRVRGIGPYWDGAEGTGRRPHTEALIDALAAAAGDWASP